MRATGRRRAGKPGTLTLPNKSNCRQMPAERSNLLISKCSTRVTAVTRVTDNSFFSFFFFFSSSHHLSPRGGSSIKSRETSLSASINCFPVATFSDFIAELSQKMRSFLVIAPVKKKLKVTCAAVTDSLPDGSWLFISSFQHQRIRAEMRYKKNKNSPLDRSSPHQIFICSSCRIPQPSMSALCFAFYSLLSLKHTDLQPPGLGHAFPFVSSASYLLTFRRFPSSFECNPVEQKHLKNNPGKKNEQKHSLQSLTRNPWRPPESLQPLQDFYTTHLFALTSQPITVRPCARRLPLPTKRFLLPCKGKEERFCRLRE